VNFEFEVEMMLIISWEDNKIFARCDGAGVGGFSATDPCGLFWQPSLLWPNVKLDPHPAATLSPAIIEDGGLTTVIGQVGAVEAGTTATPSKIANNSIGMRHYRVRGTFMGSFQFSSFPYDWQELNVTVRLPNTLPLRKARLVSRAQPQPTMGVAADTPIWSIMCVTAHSSVLDYNSGFASTFEEAADDPMASWYRRLMTLPPSEIFAEFDSTDLSPESQMWSEATMTIHVKRMTRFYDFNFIFIMCMLVLVSFGSLIVHPSSLDGRLGLTLTVVLGLNVFQIVIIDNTPATGYLTNMHAFCLASTGLVVVVALENVLAFWADRRDTKVKWLNTVLRRATGSAECRAKALMVQRAMRRYLAIKHARGRLQKQRTGSKVAWSPSATVTPVDGAPPPHDGTAATAVLAGSVARRQRSNVWRLALRVANRWLDALAVWAARFLDNFAFAAFPAVFIVLYSMTLVPPSVDSLPPQCRAAASA